MYFAGEEEGGKALADRICVPVPWDDDEGKEKGAGDGEKTARRKGEQEAGLCEHIETREKTSVSEESESASLSSSSSSSSHQFTMMESGEHGFTKTKL